MQFGMGLQAGEIESKNTAEFYAIKEFWLCAQRRAINQTGENPV